MINKINCTRKTMAFSSVSTQKNHSKHKNKNTDELRISSFFKSVKNWNHDDHLILAIIIITIT